ncbi:MAG: RDD family protein [FCB group bacterium]|jgi:uncharacterized RDD family membrane protein YckC
MKCEKCGNEYPSQYYFATPTICRSCFEKLSEQEKQSLQSSLVMQCNDEMEMRVGFGRRLGAALIDWFISTLLVAIAIFATGIFNEFKDSLMQMLTNPELMKEFQLAIMPISFIITFMYYSLEVVLAATPGKLILGIQIANQDRTYASTFTLFLRFIYKHMETILALLAFLTVIKPIDILSSIVSLAIFVGFFFVLGRKRQAFHDMFAKTAVFYKSEILERNNMQIESV